MAKSKYQGFHDLIDEVYEALAALEDKFTTKLASVEEKLAELVDGLETLEDEEDQS